jgi:hypothetical protein
MATDTAMWMTRRLTSPVRQPAPIGIPGEPAKSIAGCEGNRHVDDPATDNPKKDNPKKDRLFPLRHSSVVARLHGDPGDGNMPVLNRFLNRFSQWRPMGPGPDRSESRPVGQ